MAEKKKYQKGEMIVEGKTKKLWEVIGEPNLFLVESKEDITAFDNPEFTKKFGTKAKSATHTTCRIFELLRDAGIPVSYECQISDTEFIVRKNSMIPLEVIIRRFIGPGSSYLKRMPQLHDQLPLRFPNLLFELFLKTTKNKLVVKGKTLVADLPVEDPLISNPYDIEGSWKLVHPKKPAWDSESTVGEVSIRDFFNSVGLGLSGLTAIKEIEKMTRRIFLTLEGGWNNLGYRLLDFKIEFAIDSLSGEIMVADVIDNDSWRLRTADWREVSKQVFRDGGEMNEVEEVYTLVAHEVGKLRIRKQVLVIWSGSENDPVPKVPNIPGVDVGVMALSGHKMTKKSLSKLNDLHAAYPEGGVIIANVGMSDGLGPVLAAHTCWPIVALPATFDEFPNDVWSSLRMPSKVPMATILSPKNAVAYALNILAQKNPAVYAYLQQAIEELDV